MQLVQIAIDPNTADVGGSHKVLEVQDGEIYVQGTVIDDPEILAQTRPGPGEGVLALKRVVFTQAAEHVLQR